MGSERRRESTGVHPPGGEMGDAANVEKVVVAKDVDVPEDGWEEDESEREEQEERLERCDSPSSLDPSRRYP